jgi:signal transduction histidine kinase/integral membrane sensor domain MASE1
MGAGFNPAAVGGLNGNAAPDVRRRTNLLYAPLLVGLLYYAAAKLGFLLTFAPKPVSTFWAPNAILMGALLVMPTRRWWHFLAAALVAHFAAEISAGVPLAMVISWFISNCTEVLIGAALLRRYATSPFTLDRFTNVSLFLVFGAFAAPLLSSFLDAGFVTLNRFGDSGYWTVWQHRWLSNTLASLVIVPTVVAWHSVSLASISMMPVRRRAEALALAVVLVGVSVIVFAGAAGYPTPVMLYIPLPALVWATVRFGPRGISFALVIFVLVTVWNAVHGRGPFALQTSAQNALSIQLFFILVSTTLLVLAALLEERRQAERHATFKSDQLHVALTAAKMATWEWQVAEERQWVSSATNGDSSNVAINLEGFDGSILPADLPAVTRALAESQRTGESFLVEFRVIDAEARVRWMVGRGRTYDTPGRPQRMTGLIADITERKRADNLMAGENQILKMIASGASAEDSLTNLARLVEAETVGMSCSILQLDEDGLHVSHCAAPSLPTAYLKAINGMPIGPDVGSCGTAMYLRKPVIVADIASDPLWENFRDLALSHGLRACWSTPILSDHGKVLGALALYYREVRRPSAAEFRLMEIADHLATIILTRRRAEAQAHEQRQVLAHLSRVAVLGELAGAYAHELTQPLTSVLTNAQAAQRILSHPTPDLEVLQEILKDIVSADLHASDIIHGLRPMLMKGATHASLVDLNDLVLETQKLVRADLIAREVEISIELQGDLPLLLGDRVQLQQVILNLIINGSDAMVTSPRGDRKLAVITQCASNCEDVQLSISDRGCGIKPELLPHIFDPFFTSKKNGLGLGLSICRSIVQAHGGRLWAEPNVHGGATFHLTIEAAKEFPVQEVSAARPNESRASLID